MIVRAGWRVFFAVFVAAFLVGSSTWAAGASWTAAGVNSGAVVANAAKAGVSATGTPDLTKLYQFTSTTAAAQNIKLAALSFSNTGTAPLALTVAVVNSDAALAANIVLRFWTAASCTTVPGTGVTTGTLAVPPGLPASFANVAAGTAVTLCAATNLSTTVAASQGKSTTTTLTLTGRVGTNWVATSTPAAFTQNVYQVGNPSTVTCTNSGLGISLAMTPPPTPAPAADPAPVISYRVVKANGTFVTSGASPLTVGALNLNLGDLVLGSGPLPLIVQATETPYGTTSPGVAVAATYSLVLPAVLTVRCPA